MLKIKEIISVLFLAFLSAILGYFVRGDCERGGIVVWGSICRGFPLSYYYTWPGSRGEEIIRAKFYFSYFILDFLFWFLVFFAGLWLFKKLKIINKT